MAVLALVSPTARGSGTSAGKRQQLSRRGSGGSTGGSRRARRIPQFPQNKPPAPAAPTPFQPGASPSKPLVPILAGLGLLALFGKALWDLLNKRPAPDVQPLPEGSQITAPGTNDVRFIVNFNQGASLSNTTNCVTGLVNPGTSSTNGPNAQSVNDFGRILTIGRSGWTQNLRCESGTNSGGPAGAFLGLVNKAGTLITMAGAFTDTTTFNAPQGRTIVNTRSITSITVNGVPVPITVSTPQDFAPGTRPQAPPPSTEPPAPSPVAPPLPVPVPVPTGVPNSRPVPSPAPVPCGLPGGGQAIPKLPQAIDTIRRTFQRSTPGSQPQQITAQGVSTGPQAPTRPTATGNTFLPGLPPLVANGPPPTMQGIATEVGKLEQKLELLLAPEGPRSLLDNINKVIDQVENIKFVLENLFPPEPYTFGSGAYQLAPICDRDSEGDLLPPRLAAWPGGEGELTEVRQRIDALAQLIQHHKDLKQPTCGGRGNGPGSNVTVHFESD